MGAAAAGGAPHIPRLTNVLAHLLCTGARPIIPHMCPVQPAPRVGKPGGQRVGDAFYPTWRAGSKLWRLAQNKAYYAALAVQVSFHLHGTPPSVLHPTFWFWQLRRISSTRWAPH